MESTPMQEKHKTRSTSDKLIETTLPRLIISISTVMAIVAMFNVLGVFKTQKNPPPEAISTKELKEVANRLDSVLASITAMNAAIDTMSIQDQNTLSIAVRLSALQQRLDSLESTSNFSAIAQRIGSLERFMVTDAEEVIAVPLMRKDIEQLAKEVGRSEARTNALVETMADQWRWAIVFMAGMLVAVVAPHILGRRAG